MLIKYGNEIVNTDLIYAYEITRSSKNQIVFYSHQKYYLVFPNEEITQHILNKIYESGLMWTYFDCLDYFDEETKELKQV